MGGLCPLINSETPTLPKGDGRKSFIVCRNHNMFARNPNLNNLVWNPPEVDSAWIQLDSSSFRYNQETHSRSSSGRRNSDLPGRNLERDPAAHYHWISKFCSKLQFLCKRVGKILNIKIKRNNESFYQRQDEARGAEAEAAKTSSFCSAGFETDQVEKQCKRFNLQSGFVDHRPPGNKRTNLLHFSDEKY